MSPLSIAFLGLGAMGRPMAGHLLAAGHVLTIWNRSPGPAAALLERGARLAASPQEAVSESEVVITMLRDNEAERRVWLAEDGVLAGARPGTLAIAAGTLGPQLTRELAQSCRDRGLRFIEAPVAGSTPQAAAGQLRSLVGGDRAEVDAARPILEAWSAAVVHAGPVGAGATLKLMVNGLFTVQVAALAELLALARAQGLEPAPLLELLAQTPVCSPAAAALGRGMLGTEHAPGFPVDLVEKDLGWYTGAQVAHPRTSDFRRGLAPAPRIKMRSPTAVSNEARRRPTRWPAGFNRVGTSDLLNQVLAAAGDATLAPVCAAARDVYRSHREAGRGGLHLSVIGAPSL